MKTVRTIPIIMGDGISDEIVAQMKRIVDAALAIEDKKINWLELIAGERAISKNGSPMPDSVIEMVKQYGVAIKGPINTPKGKGYRSVNVELRKKLGLFACVRPCKYQNGSETRITNPEKIDMVIIRENTEDLYSGIELKKDTPEAGKLRNFLHEAKLGEEVPEDGVGYSIKWASETESRRIMEFALRYAKEHGRKKIHIITKSNILKETDGLFMNSAYGFYKDHANQFPGITVSDLLVDNTTQQLVMRPEIFDVLVLPNLYGDIISDLAAGLVGGLGLAPGANIGNRYAVFEATHGSWPEAAGQNRANPIALILSAKMMLEHIGEKEAADTINESVSWFLKTHGQKERSTSLTGDLLLQIMEALPIE